MLSKSDLLLPQSKLKKNLYKDVYSSINNTPNIGLQDINQANADNDSILQAQHDAELLKDINKEIAENDSKLYQKIKHIQGSTTNIGLAFYIPSKTALLFYICLQHILEYLELSDLIALRKTCRTALPYILNSVNTSSFDKQFGLHKKTGFSFNVDMTLYCKALVMNTFPDVLSNAKITINRGK